MASQESRGSTTGGGVVRPGREQEGGWPAGRPWAAGLTASLWKMGGDEPAFNGQGAGTQEPPQSTAMLSLLIIL